MEHVTEAGSPIERAEIAELPLAKGGRRPPVRIRRAATLVLVAGLLGFGGLGCWAARSRVVNPPEFASVDERLDIPLEIGTRSVDGGVSTALVDSPDSREAWEPVAPDRVWRYIVLHHSASDHGSVESIDAEHRKRTDDRGNPWLGIGYHFVIGNGDEMSDGEVVPTFRWRQQLAGAHAGETEYNAAGIGVCVIGDCESNPPSARQVTALKELVGMLAARYQISSNAVVGHSDVKATDCPGRYFPLEEVARAADPVTAEK